MCLSRPTWKWTSGWNVSDTIDYGEVNDSLVMKYISCPKSIVDTLLDKGDSIYLHANEYKLEFLGLDNEEYNRRLVAKYGDTIPAIVSIMSLMTC